MTAKEAIARARAVAFPKPIVIIHMSAEQYDAAMREASEVELKELANGVLSGQIEVSA